MKDIEAWDLLHGNNCTAKSLTELIGEMGFKEDSYMVVRRDGPRLKVGDQRDASGALIENKYLSFGKDHLHPGYEELKTQDPSYQNIYDDFGAIDKKMHDYSISSNSGRAVTGMTGSNNGVYCAMANGGNEFIITKDREIIQQLEKQLGFAPDCLGVPLSNGGKPLDYNKQSEWEMVEHRCKQEAINRARGTSERPKSIKSPFRDEYGQMNKDYVQHRASQLQGR